MRAWFLKGLFGLFAIVPLTMAHGLGAALGKLFSVIPNRRQRTARTNLALCFPALSVDERERLLRRNLAEYCKSVTEVGTLWTCDSERIRRLVRATSGELELAQAIARGKGVILALPHLGAWELVNLHCSLRYPVTTLYREPPMSQLGAMMRRARERFGARLLSPNSGGIRGLYQALGRGELVSLLPDQVPAHRSGSVFAPFFGIPASTMVLLSRLAIKSGAPVIFAYAERLARGPGYHLHFVVAPAEINRDDVESSAAVVNRMVEQCVRAAPEQYQWVYKRFRVAPARHKAPY